MTNEQLDSFRVRRVLWPRNDGTAHVFTIEFSGAMEGVKVKKILKEWIATHSVGEFYLGHNVLAFYTDIDATAFKIADCMNKVKVEYELKKHYAQRI